MRLVSTSFNCDFLEFSRSFLKSSHFYAVFFLKFAHLSDTKLLVFLLKFTIFSDSLLFGQNLGTANKMTTGTPTNRRSTIIMAAAAPPPPDDFSSIGGEGVTLIGSGVVSAGFVVF